MQGKNNKQKEEGKWKKQEKKYKQSNKRKKERKNKGKSGTKKQKNESTQSEKGKKQKVEKRISGIHSREVSVDIDVEPKRYKSHLIIIITSNNKKWVGNRFFSGQNIAISTLLFPIGELSKAPHIL